MSYSLEAFGALLEQDAQGRRSDRPAEVPVDQLVTKPEVFQPRQYWEDSPYSKQHITSIARAIERGSKPDPLLVRVIGQEIVVIDGHHRLEAYRKAGLKGPVSVEYFEGSLLQAVAMTGKANSCDKLPMSDADKSEHAWRLVLLCARGAEKLTVEQIAQCAQRSARLVKQMRARLRELSKEHPLEELSGWSWREVLYGSRPEPGGDDWESALAVEWCGRLVRDFGMKAAEQPHIFASALEAYSPRLLANDGLRPLGLR